MQDSDKKKLIGFSKVVAWVILLILVYMIYDVLHTWLPGIHYQLDVLDGKLNNIS